MGEGAAVGGCWRWDSALAGGRPRGWGAGWIPLDGPRALPCAAVSLCALPAAALAGVSSRGRTGGGHYRPGKGLGSLLERDSGEDLPGLRGVWSTARSPCSAPAPSPFSRGPEFLLTPTALGSPEGFGVGRDAATTLGDFTLRTDSA